MKQWGSDKDMKKKLYLLPIFIVVLVASGSAQFIDFPAGYSNIPREKLKGPAHTVLTTEQREEKVFSTTVEVYDEKGRLTEALSSNAGIEHHSGKLVRLGGKSTYIYDQSGRLSRMNSFGPEGEFNGYTLYKYDEKGRLTEELLFTSEGKDRGYTKYAYSPEKREVEATWSFYTPGKSSPAIRSVLTYDEKERWTSRTRLPASNDKVTFEYDNKGNFIKETHCCKYNFWHVYAHKFDKYGNWIERENTYFQNGNDGGEESTPGWMNAYRIITYYPDHSTVQK